MRDNAASRLGPVAAVLGMLTFVLICGQDVLAQATSITVVIPASQTISMPKSKAGTCGHPRIGYNRITHRCELQLSDVETELTIERTLLLAPGTHLDCRDKSLIPWQPPPDPTVHVLAPRSRPTPYPRSAPPAAIVILGADGVIVERCKIGKEDLPFDAGIVVLRKKKSEPKIVGDKPGQVEYLGWRQNLLQANTVWVKDVGVLLVGSDDNVIKNNQINFASSRALGVGLIRDSDYNQVIGNTIQHDDKTSDRPAGVFERLRNFCSGCGIASFDPPGQPLLSFLFLNNKPPGSYVTPIVVQFPNTLSSRNEANVVGGEDDQEANQVKLPNSSGIGIAAGTRSVDTMILRNKVTSGGTGIAAAGFKRLSAAPLPGFCGNKQNRMCTTNGNECNIPWIDAGPNDTCGPEPIETTDGRASGTHIENNIVTGSFANSPFGVWGTSGIAGGETVKVVIRGNTIEGTRKGHGIALMSEALGTFPRGNAAEVAGNIITGPLTYGLFLDHTDTADPTPAKRFRAADYFGAWVSGNTIPVTQSKRAIGYRCDYPMPMGQTCPAYIFETDLKANNWNRNCNDFGGFHDYNEPSPDTPLPEIKDSAPVCK